MMKDILTGKIERNVNVNEKKSVSDLHVQIWSEL